MPLPYRPENDKALRVCSLAQPPLAVEKTFGWLKQTGPLGRLKLRGLPKVDWAFVFSCAANNLLRLPRLRSSGRPAKKPNR